MIRELSIFNRFDIDTLKEIVTLLESQTEVRKDGYIFQLKDLFIHIINDVTSFRLKKDELQRLISLQEDKQKTARKNESSRFDERGKKIWRIKK